MSGIALVAAAGAALVGIGVGQAPAGNRDAVVQLVGVPGPDHVTYGESVASAASILNPGTSTYTHVTFHNPIPTTIVDGAPVQATFKEASCQGVLTATEFVCDEVAQVMPGQTATVTVVWQTPSAGSSANCPASTPTCMTNSAYWTIKEGEGNPGSAGPDTFFMGPVVTALLVPGASSAGAYALSACSDPGTPTLETDPDLGPGNPLSTAVCASSLPVGDPFNPGLAVSIDERNHTPSDPGVTQVSEICIPAPGAACSDPGYAPWVFSPFATFSFEIDNRSLPKGYKITKVFHDGVPVPFDPSADPHVVSITVDHKNKITNAVVEGSTNGHWTF
jgi:hypothetical protein